MDPLSLRNLSIISATQRMYNKDLDDIFDHMLLPEEIVRAIRSVHDEIHFWKNDMQHLEFLAASERIPHDERVRPNRLDFLRILQLDIIDRHKHVLRWSESSSRNNSTIEIDPLATARRILANYEPGWYSPFVNDVAFALASLHCLEDQVQRIWPHSSRLASSIHRNAAVAYWSQKMRGQVAEARRTLKELVYGTGHGANRVSLYKCYPSIPAFWPIIVREFGQFPAVEVVEWLRVALMAPIEYRAAERVRSFLWRQIPADTHTLIISDPPQCYDFLCAMLQNGQSEKFVEIWTLFDGNKRREGFAVIRTTLIEATRFNKPALVERVLRTVVIGRLHEPWIAEFIGDISSAAVAIWRSLEERPDERSRRFRAEYAEFVPLIANKVSSRKDIAALWNECSDEQRMQILALTRNPRPDGNGAIPARMRLMFFEALMLDDGKAFKCLYRRAKDDGNPALLVSLRALSAFDLEQKSQLRTLMSAKQARLCGYDGVPPNVPWVDEEDSLDYS